MKKGWLPVIFGMAFLVLCGCNTPGSRIKKNQALFDTYDMGVQENIRNGKVDVGYTRDMVYMALGDPDREYSRKTAAGTTEVWSYTDVYTTPDRQMVDARFSYRDAKGHYRTETDRVWVDVRQKHEYEVLRVEFNGEKVTAVEEVKSNRKAPAFML